MKRDLFERLTGAAFMWLMLVWLLMAGTLAAAETTNAKSPGLFLPLPDLLREWGDVSIADVQRAAEGGELTAQHYLGYCYAEGIRVSPDAALAVSWYERAG